MICKNYFQYINSIISLTEVFDKDKVAIVPDHFTPNKDIKAAEQCKCVRAFAYDKEVTNYFEVKVLLFHLLRFLAQGSVMIP